MDLTFKQQTNTVKFEKCAFIKKFELFSIKYRLESFRVSCEKLHLTPNSKFIKLLSTVLTETSIYLVPFNLFCPVLKETNKAFSRTLKSRRIISNHDETVTSVAYLGNDHLKEKNGTKTESFHSMERHSLFVRLYQPPNHRAPSYRFKNGLCAADAQIAKHQ